MDLEATLQGKTEATAEDNPNLLRTDGIALDLAVEHGAVPGPQPGGAPAPSGKRPGRPPIHGRYSQAAGSDGKNPVPLPGEAALSAPEVAGGTQQRVVIPPDLLAKVVKETLTLGENWAGHRVEGVAALAGLTQEEIEPQLAQTKLGDERKELVAELTPYALKEWGLDAEMSPTLAIALMIVPWSLGAMSSYNTLAKLAVERHERELKEKANSPGN